MAPRIRRSRQNNKDKNADNCIEVLRLEETGCDRASGGSKKRTRGPTFLLDMWRWDDDKPLIKVEFNKTGQPIGMNSGKFAEFLGVLSRNGKFAPIDILDWRDMPDGKKRKMIETVKERFELPPGSESWVLTSIRKKWRNYKARVKAKYYDHSLTLEQLSDKKPRYIMDSQWEKLLDHWKLEKTMVLSERNKSHRAMKTMNHTTGKVSFAEVREDMEKTFGNPPTRLDLFDTCYTDENGDPTNDIVGEKLVAMKKHQTDLPEGSVDAVGREDSFAKVMGKDPLGLVRMYGLGVNPSDVWDEIPSRTTCHRISKENEFAMSKMEERVNEQSTKLDEQASQIATQAAQMASQAAEIAELKAMVLQQRPSNDRPANRSSRYPSLGSNGSTQGKENSIKVGNSVVLKSIKNFQSNLAEGRLVSLNPSQDVGGTLLGENWCEVHVLVPIEMKEPLLRSYAWFKTIGDVIGVSIAWPCHLVALKDGGT